MISPIGNTTPNARERHAPAALRGRAAQSNDDGRFERHRRSVFEDGWGKAADQAPKQKPTQVHTETPKAIITRNTSPDVPFSQSVNAYRGCEHGCIYCFARPSHAYMGLSAGQDFETEIFAKPSAARLLEQEIKRPGYRMRTIAMGTNTDPYQPVEDTQRITRAMLEVLAAHDHPVSIVTKSHRILRDLDILRPMATQGLVSVGISVTSLDHRLSRSLEPRASSPGKRLETIEALVSAGIPVTAMVAPIIPGLTDHEIERILAACAGAGASRAAWVMLRLPGEVAALFSQWLNVHAPERRSKILNTVADMRGGKLNDPRFGGRMRGSGPVADLIAARFRAAAKRNKLQIAKTSDMEALAPVHDLFGDEGGAAKTRPTGRPAPQRGNTAAARNGVPRHRLAAEHTVASKVRRKRATSGQQLSLF